MPGEYVTSNIRLPRALHRDLKMRSAREGKSMAQIVRECIEANLHTHRQIETRRKRKKDSLFNIIGLYSDGIMDGSINHDSMIYGSENDHIH